MKLLLLLLCFVSPVFAGPKAVVELFTSQGCSSCPSADAYLGELKKRDDLIVISWNVDIWDYLGWKDTLADSLYTKRQRTYAMGRGDGKVYTPQIIVSGREHEVGSDKIDVEQKIKKAKKFTIEPVLTRQNEMLTVTLPLLPSKYFVLAVPISSEKTVAIIRGENRGNTMVYHRVARGLIPLGMQDGSIKNFSLDLTKLPRDCDTVVILLQEKDDKQNLIGLLGAAELALR